MKLKVRYILFVSRIPGFVRQTTWNIALFEVVFTDFIVLQSKIGEVTVFGAGLAT